MTCTTCELKPAISTVIRERIEEAGARYWANDNISNFIADDYERQDLIDEVTEKFDGVLRSLLIDVDTDPNSNDTPRRLAKMYVNEIMSGRFDKMPKVTAFPNDSEDRYDGMLVVRAQVHSVCSHHHQPVAGAAYIGILLGKTAIGLSKYIRIAKWHARRGTLQEELTVNIAREIQRVAGTEHVGVYIEATHGCVSCRGVMQDNSLTQTTVLYGNFREDVKTKEEFMSNIKLQKMS